MTYNAAAPRRAVNLLVNEDLLDRSTALTSNLSRTVEELLARFVEAEYARKRDDDKALDQMLDALDAHHAEHGFITDDFPSL